MLYTATYLWVVRTVSSSPFHLVQAVGGWPPGKLWLRAILDARLGALQP